ncbi:hypothetical protein ACN6K9_002537 [Streptomyces sp. SAS_267]|uniref:hypothetical protein n=1 Tax=unclassified Streptomyces TaxID=2593676 RepID=UPI0036F7582D
MTRHLIDLLNSPFITALLATHSVTVAGLALTAVCAPTARRRQAALRALAVLRGRPPRPPRPRG